MTVQKPNTNPLTPEKREKGKEKEGQKENRERDHELMRTLLGGGR